ncbi:Phosphate transporter PHO1 -like protein 3 [Capsicum chinense]|nr:Phosphate transporter PHO1 -like protein 3 [Capsicum chinense]
MVIIPYHGKLLSKQAISDINYKRKGDIENQESEIGKNHHENSTNLWNGNLFIPAEIGQKEKSFFEKLDNELEKVNSFYKVQVEEAKDEAAALGKQMDALIALRKKVKEKDRKGNKATSAASSKVTSPSRASSEGMDMGAFEGQICHDLVCLNAEKKQLDFKEEVDKFGENIIKPVSSSNNIDPSLYEHGLTPSDVLECVNIQHTSGGPKSSAAEKECSFSREELKEVEVKLKKAFVELYQKLRHLNQYSFINLSAFSVILEKYEKITSRKVKRSYMKFVDSSYIGSSDEVNNLLNKVEATFVKHFSNSEQGDAIKLLTPKRKRQKCSVRFVSGFFCGFSIALIMAVVLIIKTRKLLDKEEATVYLDSIFPLYRLHKKMTWKVWALASSVVAALANISWDIKMDWGLLQRRSRNFLLRDELLLHHKTPYYIAMILEVLLRFVWLQVVLGFDMCPLRGKVVTSTFASLEILRRGIWNFFRLENEHLNNVGEYRAFKSLPLPFIAYDEKDSKNLKDDSSSG